MLSTTPLPPAIDYTNKDYASFRQAMLDLAAYRLPEWTDRSEADPGVLLVELFAYMGDILAYYQDRIASESFLTTATERRSVLNMLRLIGYQLTPPLAAQAELQLTFNAPQQGQPTTAVVPTGAQFATKPSNGSPAVMFEYHGPDLTIDLSKSLTFNPLPVQHSATVKQEVLGSSTGVANQRFALSQQPVIPESVEVFVDEGAGQVKWNPRENLLYFIADDGSVQIAGPNSTDYYVEYDENWTAWIVFGDGEYGRRPAPGGSNIRANYRVGGGAVGNVAANTIVDPKTKIQPMKQVTNLNAAGGGVDAETIDHAVRFAPLAFRSGNRAVTLNDYVSLAQQAGGVAKVQAVSMGWNRIDLYVAPQAATVTTTPDALKQKLITFFEDRRMAGTLISIKDPTPALIGIDVEVFVAHNYNPDFVKQSALAAVQGLLSFSNMDFAQVLYISQIYQAVESLAGVLAVNVGRFQREDIAGQPALPPDGRIVVGEFEIPVLQTANVSLGSQFRFRPGIASV